MGSDIILCMALIASFAFVIQFLLSILGSDLDTDIDIDSASDLSMSLSDIISFKGITHFILGYSWTTYFSGSHLVGVVIGSLFFIVLFYVYKLLLKLKQEMVYECPEDLNGREVEIVFRSGKNHYMVNISKNGRQEQMRVRCLSSNPQIAIQYKMVNQWKEIAGEQVKAFEHINLGNITVFDGGQNSTGNFLNNVVKTVAPALGVIDQLPIADTLKKLKGDDKK